MYKKLDFKCSVKNKMMKKHESHVAKKTKQEKIEPKS